MNVSALEESMNEAKDLLKMKEQSVAELTEYMHEQS
jgi:hypothetical protein